ncbi:MAG: zinc ABC transporter substrate-binding protein [Rhodospirillaceae bacterium]|nr:zinc ABC transporter substrate-binding protein [Rhodospirillaceae bacterium]
MHFMISPLATTLTLWLVLISGSAAVAKSPLVVASIKPIHSLISSVMKGVDLPLLLIKGNASPHQFSLKPSQARALHDADLVVWVGHALETTLQRPIKSIKDRRKIVELIRLKGLKLLKSSDHDHSSSELDPHLWLDIGNAITIVEEIVQRLSGLNPANRHLYVSNGKSLQSKLSELDGKVRSQLASVRTTPFMVYHDAYRYFEKRYQLNSQGAVVVSADRRPGARGIHQTRRKIKKNGVRCLFSEPQFSSQSLKTITTTTGIHLAELDPLGTLAPTGPEAYFHLMRRMTRAIAGCLRKP